MVIKKKITTENPQQYLFLFCSLLSTNKNSNFRILGNIFNDELVNQLFCCCEPSKQTDSLKQILTSQLSCSLSDSV